MKDKLEKKGRNACLYCRRSHMTCDNERPCGRCVKRKIANLCCDYVSKRDARRIATVKEESAPHSSGLFAPSKFTDRTDIIQDPIGEERTLSLLLARHISENGLSPPQFTTELENAKFMAGATKVYDYLVAYDEFKSFANSR